MRVEVLNTFKYAFGGTRVVEYGPGVQDVPDEAVAGAIDDGNAKPVSLSKMSVEELKALAKVKYPDVELPKGALKNDIIGFIKSGVSFLFGVEFLSQKELPELMQIAKDKYPDVAIPDVFKKEDLITFIGNGDAAIFEAKDETFEGVEFPELVDIARERYPDVEIPDYLCNYTTRDDLVAFINNGEEVHLDIGKDALKEMSRAELFEHASKLVGGKDIPESITDENLLKYAIIGDTSILTEGSGD